MKDIKGFCKLMDIPIPDYDHFEYYISQLSKIDKFKNLNDLIKIYESDEEKYGDLFGKKMSMSGALIEFLKSTTAYTDMIEDNLIKDYPTTKNFEYSEIKKYLSIDIKRANWISLKKYDPSFLNQLGNSYEELLDKFDSLEIFKYSKHFRQFIFGNINPKRQGKVQRDIVESVIQHYNYTGLEIVCIKNDEVIYSFDTFDEISKILVSIDSDIFKTKIFTIERVEDFKVNSYYSEVGDFLYKDMIGCNGNKYYIYLKKYITKESLDIRDLYFKMDGSMAIWSVDNLKVSL